MKEKTIDQLIKHCLQFLNETGYSQGTIHDYNKCWKAGILKFMSERQQTVYSKTIGEEFLNNLIRKNYKLSVEHMYNRSIRMLNDMIETNNIRKTSKTVPKYPLPGNIGAKMELLITHMQDLRRNKDTISDYYLYFNTFLNYLSDNNIFEVHQITEHHIIAYIDRTLQSNNKRLITALRSLFRFWYDNNITSTDFKPILSIYKFKNKEKIPSFYTKEEVFQIESSIERSSKLGKRNYAMLLLATRIGLRVSDITNLQFSDIDWEKNSISLTMYKTGKIIELPLLADIGNAIIDYLRHGRPNSTSRYIFLAGIAPFDVMTIESVSTNIRNIIVKSGVCTEGRYHGPHSMRHSLASALLQNSTTLPVISEVLGHKRTQTTMIYLKIDINSLMQCALPVSLVSDDFYNQKGGVFYE